MPLIPIRAMHPGGSKYRHAALSMGLLATLLSRFERETVVDRTGLSGTYDVTLHFQVVPLEPDASAPDP